MKNLKARGVFERAFYVFMTLSLLAFTVQIVSGATSVKQADVTATVLGTKPIVDNFDPTTAINNVSTAVTAIVGKNFTGATVVTLDDASATVLTGSITVIDNTDDDPTVAGVGAGGSYQKIIGLSVPSGVATGIYNVLVTTAQGTNSTSTAKITVQAPAAGADTQIVSVSPNPVFVKINNNISVDLAVNDSDSSTVYYDITELGGTFDAASGSIALSGGEGVANLTYTTSGSAGFYQNTFKVNDQDGLLPGTFEDLFTVNFYVQP